MLKQTFTTFFFTSVILLSVLVLYSWLRSSSNLFTWSVNERGLLMRSLDLLLYGLTSKKKVRKGSKQTYYGCSGGTPASKFWGAKRGQKKFLGGMWKMDAKHTKIWHFCHFHAEIFKFVLILTHLSLFWGKNGGWEENIFWEEDKFPMFPVMPPLYGWHVGHITVLVSLLCLIWSLVMQNFAEKNFSQLLQLSDKDMKKLNFWDTWCIYNPRSSRSF